METIAQAVHAAISSNPNRLKADVIAKLMSVNVSTVYKWGETEGEIPLARLVQFVLITGDTRPMMALCRVAGGTFLPLPRLGGDESAERESITAIKEFGEFLQSNADGLRDGMITPAEAKNLAKEGQDAIRAIVRIIEHAIAASERTR